MRIVLAFLATVLVSACGDAPPELFFASLAARLDGPKAGDTRLVLNVTFADQNAS